jgi:hypothetical protein
MMLDMNMDDPCVQKNRVRMESYEREMIDAGEHHFTTYQQKELIPAEGYEGATLFGRAYTGSQLNWMSRKIVNTMYKMSHQEVDMVCCYPTMIYTLFEHLPLTAFRMWVQNPSQVLASVSAETGFDTVEVKRGLVSMICSMPDVCYGFNDNDKSAIFGSHRFVQGILSDLRIICREMKTVYPQFWKTIEVQAAADKNQHHAEGVALSYLAADMEHCIMREVVSFFNPDTNDMVWYFDGVLVPNIAIGNRDEVCERLKDMIADKFEIPCRFRVKDIAANSIAWSLGPRDLDPNNYASFKRSFERSFFVLQHPAKVCRLHNGIVRFLNKEEFNLLTANMGPKEFVNQWLSDRTRREYKGLEFTPPPLTPKHDHFNTWRGFAAETLPPIQNRAEVLRRAEPFQRHCRLMMGNDETNYEYFVKLFAWKFQNPGLKWNVMPIIMSAQGIGKDFFFKFIAEMVGPAYCHDGDTFGEIVGTNTALVSDKLFVFMTELKAEDSFKHVEKIKKMITNDNMTVEAKYVQPYVNRSVMCMVGYANSYNAVVIKSDDRRFFPVVADCRYRNDPTYHDPFVAYVRDPVNQRAVFQFLREVIDVSNFQPWSARPVTDVHKEMAGEAPSYGDQFLKSYWTNMKVDAESRSQGFEIQNNALRVECYEIGNMAEHLFVEHFKIAGLSKSKCATKISTCLRELSSKIDKYAEEGVTPISKGRSKSTRYYLFDIPSVEAYMQNELSNMAEIEHDAHGPYDNAVTLVHR